MDKIKIGIIGGTGLERIDGFKKQKELSVSTPFGKPSDCLITGTLGDVPVVFLSRHGRHHTLCPHEINFRANIFAMKKVGVERVVAITAVGSMKEEIVPGDLVICDQLIDWTRRRHSTFFSEGLVGHSSFGDPVCPSLSQALYETAKHACFRAHSTGTYLCIDGPQFSARAESLLYRSWGVDVIGMTAAQEVKLAREAELCYCAVALATDYDCWKGKNEVVDNSMVMRTLRENAKRATELVIRALPALMATPLKCNCRESMKGAFLTPLSKVPAKLRKSLRPLYGHYLSKN